MYKRPRIKEIYPVYRLDQEHFRIGAQIGITKEFYDPTEQLWNLATILDGRSLKDVLDEERRRFPDLELSDDYILDGINLLDQEGFLEETDLKEEECLNARYMPNVRYFSHYINSTNDRFHVQKKIQESTILEIDYENFSSFAHKPWPRYPDKCPTCGNGKVEDWEVFKYYGLFK